jgi:Raf kinase inhibitor-like YbhB/YbcL family protein
VDFTLTSPAFAQSGEIPSEHTCDGADVSPALEWSAPPEGTRSLALVVDDPDAPSGTFTHWLAWGLPPRAGGLGEGEAAPLEGRNDFGAVGYRGPCPPPGHGRHRYFFRLHALDAELDLLPGAERHELEPLLGGHVLGVAELIGTYERS